MKVKFNSWLRGTVLGGPKWYVIIFGFECAQKLVALQGNFCLLRNN
jgi:hypothetical protein